jgi:dethiobiotin synthetase
VIRLAVTGTDTGVGKTVVATALLAMLRRRGLRVAGMKPIETGVVRGDPASDAALLRIAAGAGDPLDDVCPVVLPDPLAPLVAAHRAGIELDVTALDTAFARLSGGRDAIVVEGAGGLLVPITATMAFDQLFRRWRLELIIVAANRLGAINHVLLTVRAARAAELTVRGVVLVEAEEGAQDLAVATNAEVLASLIPDVPIARFPFVACPTDREALAAAAERAGLDALVPAAQHFTQTEQ